ncbi:MAG: amidase [Candidatus Latescibacterota bacterium]|nr:amidase [Candidatus Latescibacterota bacterium]
MSEEDPILSDSAVESFAELVGLTPDDSRFEKYAEQVQAYATACESLYTVSIENATAPALDYYPPRPSTQGPVDFQLDDKPTERPDEKSDIAFLSLSDLSRLIRSGVLSPVELTELYLERLDGLGRDLNSVITLTPDIARRQAERAESEILKGAWRGQLHGVPWGAKDLLATKAVPTTWGSTVYKGQVPDYDAAVVERLENAGAVLSAKLSMGSLAYGPNWFGGMTRNPWNTETGSSGSSAGPGAATAAGLIGFSIGTETHGSITSPSHTCGVTGLRPTFGRVSRYGAMALGYSLDKIGPMCRSAEDCAAVFSAIAGRDSRDAVTVDAPFGWPDNRDVRSMRIGYVEQEYERVEGASADVDSTALDVFRELGAEVTPVTLPAFPAGLLITLWVEAASAFDELARSEDLDLLENDNSQWPKIFRAAQSIPATAYVRAQRLRANLLDAFETMMQDWDAIVCPAQGESSLTLGNLTGHPSLTFPVGFVDGMPRGMTVIGELWDEASILSLGHAFQSATDWHLKRPPLDV